MQAMVDLYQAVCRVNEGGRLYPTPDCKLVRYALDLMVRRGALVPVGATATSLRGYVAIPVDRIDAVIGSEDAR